MSSKKYSDLGSPQVHQRHAVMIEGGTVPRARVMDQTLIDRYLIDGLLTLQEHQAGEYLLSQAAKAGIFTKPLRDEAGAGEANADSMESESLMRYGRTLALVRKRYGQEHQRLVEDVVIDGLDVSRDKRLLVMLKQALGLISDRRMAGGRKDKRLGAYRARSFYKGCYDEFLSDPSAQYLMTFSEYKRKWAKAKREAQKCSAVVEGRRKKGRKSRRKKSSRSM